MYLVLYCINILVNKLCATCTSLILTTVYWYSRTRILINSSASATVYISLTFMHLELFPTLHHHVSVGKKKSWMFVFCVARRAQEGLHQIRSPAPHQPPPTTTTRLPRNTHTSTPRPTYTPRKKHQHYGSKPFRGSKSTRGPRNATPR